MNARDKQWQMGYKIASRRSALGLSQEALAEAVGISRVSIVRMGKAGVHQHHRGERGPLRVHPGIYLQTG